MSLYATVEDFDRFGIRPSALPDSITAADKLAAIRAASGRADSYLNARHPRTVLELHVGKTSPKLGLSSGRGRANGRWVNPSAKSTSIFAWNASRQAPPGA